MICMVVCRILGPLISTVPCRVQFDDSSSLANLLSTIQNEYGAMLAYSHASLIDVKKWSEIEGEMFDTLFTFQNMTDGQRDYKTLFEPLEIATNLNTHSIHHTFELIVDPQLASMAVYAKYDPANMTWSQARWMLDEFDHTLCQMHKILETKEPISELWDLSPAQTEFIRSASCGPKVPLPYELLHHAFEARAKLHPDVRAIEYEGKWLSYGELDSQANTVASRLASLESIGCRHRVSACDVSPRRPSWSTNSLKQHKTLTKTKHNF